VGTAVRPAKTSPGPWDVLADVDGFVGEVLAELTAMERDATNRAQAGPGRSGTAQGRDGDLVCLLL
jgi:hypothetical protein